MATVVVLAAAGIYLVVIGQLLDTKNIRSGIIFKALPTLIGTACLIAALKALGWI